MSISIIKTDDINSAKKIIKNIQKLKTNKNSLKEKYTDITCRNFSRKHPFVETVDDFNDGIFIIDDKDIKIYHLDRMEIDDLSIDISELNFNENHIEDMIADDEGFIPVYFTPVILYFRTIDGEDMLNIIAFVRSDGSIVKYCKLESDILNTVNMCLATVSGRKRRKPRKKTRKR